MTIQEIFDSSVVSSLEIEILDAQFQQEQLTYEDKAYTKIIASLLEVRRRQLNSMFVMTDEYKALLTDFNDCLSKAVIQAAHQAEAIYQQDWSQAKGEVNIYAKCFLGYKHSSIHPVQTMRARKIWAILAGCIDYYDAMYVDGIVYGGVKACGRGNIFDEKQTNQILYACDTLDNWNEGLDRKQTKDMHLSRHFHHLFDHCLFSIFDLLWVRDFNFETYAEYHSSTLADDDPNDLDWSKTDYYD